MSEIAPPDVWSRLSQAEAENKRLRGLCRQAEPFLGTFAMTAESERKWSEEFRAVRGLSEEGGDGT